MWQFQLEWHVHRWPGFPLPTIVSALLQSRLLSALLTLSLSPPFSASFPFQPMIIDPEKEREKWKTAAADADAIYGYCKLRAKAPRRSTNSTVVQSPSPSLLHTVSHRLVHSFHEIQHYVYNPTTCDFFLQLMISTLCIRKSFGLHCMILN